MDGMFTALFLPILKKIDYQCEVKEVRHNTQKEKRIIDTLEPVMNQHRLIVDKQLILDDKKSVEIYPLEQQQQYSLFYQMTRITRDRGCLGHDDRVDCLAMLVSECLAFLQVDEDEEIRLREEAEFEAEIERIWGDSDKTTHSWYDL